MSDSILFPSASLSKLSACPSTKIPQTTDWILQDFYATQLQGNDMCQFSDDLIASWFEYSNVVALEDEPMPDLDSARSSDYGDDAEEELSRYIEMFPTSLKQDSFHSADEMPTNQLDNRGRSDRCVTKRKSTSSFSSFRSVMHLLQGKKSKSERKPDGFNRLFGYFRRH